MVYVYMRGTFILWSTRTYMQRVLLTTCIRHATYFVFGLKKSVLFSLHVCAAHVACSDV